MCSTLTHQISTPSRLHFTLIDMNGEIGRVDGSLGLSIQNPCLSFNFGPCRGTVVHADTSDEQELLLDELAAASELLQAKPDIEIEILKMIPPHQGLGSGTQVRLAVLTALNHVLELNHSYTKLGRISARGGTSGIGINAFQIGGLLLDGGHSVSEQKTSFAPSHFATKVGQPPLLMRAAFPNEWGIVLFVPSNLRGLAGQDELDFMLDNTPIPLDEVQSTSHIILMRLLPALREFDIASFGWCVRAIQEIGWKRRHWNRPDIQPLQPVKSAFEDAAGIHGCGLSSTGASVFGFFDTTKFLDDEISRNLRDELEKQSIVQGHVLCTRANNSGMLLKPIA